MAIPDYADAFQVKIEVTIEKRQPSYHGKEMIGYKQEFNIQARGFAGVAKILGDLDNAVGSITRDFGDE